ncbi:hypothetical protein [Nocardioides perillae]|uniref:ARB-07466-like C-terminal domain-containing protein n=1 Tax=Nocardioides perillae TaxID=1119534 RepID=A0A7Y9RUH6_9ACTN|nr:hypothetical protein [Nocardioides perillae]NYG55561.1 hypothetical protein [Nocardioides perillae]
MADIRHERDTAARHEDHPTAPAAGTTPGSGRRFRRPSRAALVAAPVAVVATAATVAVGVVGSGSATPLPVAAQDSVVVGEPLERVVPVSRAGQRQPGLQRAYDRNARRVARAEAREAAARATRKAVAAADTRLWTTAPLNLWTLPGGDARKVGTLAEGRKVLVTGRAAQGREEVVVKGLSRWVTAGYLTSEEPAPPVEEVAARAAAGDATCSNGTSVSPGVSPNVAKVHAATCAAFPQITSYGDFRSDGEHSQGIALDIMVSGDLGWQVAEYLRANHAELGISYLIYAQKIWSVERSGEGWRGMEDRGSTTANHYDHVHVTTY